MISKYVLSTFVTFSSLIYEKPLSHFTVKGNKFGVETDFTTNRLTQGVSLFIIKINLVYINNFSIYKDHTIPIVINFTIIILRLIYKKKISVLRFISSWRLWFEILLVFLVRKIRGIERSKSVSGIKTFMGSGMEIDFLNL
jgi:hypothetical protein